MTQLIYRRKRFVWAFTLEFPGRAKFFMHWFDCDDEGEQNGREYMAKQNAHHMFRL